MIRFGERSIDIDPLIQEAEAAVLIALNLMAGIGSAIREDSPFAIDNLEWDSPIMDDIYRNLTLFGSSILGKAGLLVVVGDHAIVGDHTSRRPISGNPVTTTGRYECISSVFLEKPVLVGDDYETHVVPAMEFTVTDIPMEHADDSSTTGTVLRFPSVSFPLLGQTPQVYEYAQAF